MCGGSESGPAFPYASRWQGQAFGYRACRTCRTTFIDPAPTAELLEALYQPADYHDRFYDDDEGPAAAETVRFLAGHLAPGSRVLDFGCGSGQLIKALKAEGFAAEGAEFSAASSANAARRSGCVVHDLSQPDWQRHGPWHCIHLGDVIEHLVDPRGTIEAILGHLDQGGLLSATGPLEANRSPVRTAIVFSGWLKQRLRPGRIAEIPPYHLLFTNAAAQRGLFRRLGQPLKEIAWQVQETGWPYRGQDFVRDAIARVAIAGSRIVPGWGNRYRTLLRKEG